MTWQEATVFAVLGAALVGFVQGRYRYDVVALMALLVVTITGIIPAEDAFTGLGHPAVITVAAVLVVSRTLTNAGVVDILARLVERAGRRLTMQVLALTFIVTAISGFLSSVAAAALLMPVAIKLARKADRPPSLLLMPVAFGSLLGAQLTLIGSSPNLIIAGFRAEALGEPFRMFDYMPVGGVVAGAGVVFITAIGWRLLPRRRGKGAPEDLFQLGEYLAEVRVPEGAKIADRPLSDLDAATELAVVALARGRRVMRAPAMFEIVREGDIVIVEADPEQLKVLIDDFGMEMAGSRDLPPQDDEVEPIDPVVSDEVDLMEGVVSPTSPLVGQTARAQRMRERYGVNILGISRQGARIAQRLARVSLRAGDVLLLQGRREVLPETMAQLGCLPLADRGLRIGKPRRILAALAVFAAALSLSATGVVEVHIAFAAGAVTMIVFRLLSIREAYAAIDPSLLVLLGAMIPIGLALESTGGAARIADSILSATGSLTPTATMAVVLVGTMLLSDVINNAAAAVLMAPIGIAIAQGIGASPDPFLMAVAVGASSAFLTPIGHQSNTLVLGPGGYRFGDFARMGILLEVTIVIASVITIPRVWPFGV